MNPTDRDTAIPADVMEAAHNVMVDAIWLADDTTIAFDAAREAIARAIMAERERCALVAAEFSTHWGVAYKTMTDQIADAIRTPPKEPKMTDKPEPVTHCVYVSETKLAACAKSHPGSFPVYSVSTVEALIAERDAARNERYQLAYAITGGEDAPGLLDSVTVAQLVEIQRSNVRHHHESIDREIALAGRVKKLEDVLRNFTASRDVSYVEALTIARAALKEKTDV